MTDKPMTIDSDMFAENLIKEHEEHLKSSIRQAYKSILNESEIDYESLEGALRCAIDDLEAIQGLMDYAEDDGDE
jgi:hypothetical protein